MQVGNRLASHQGRHTPICFHIPMDTDSLPFY